jgi:hypothetical protein
LGATFDGAGVDANIFNPIEIERNTAIGFEGAAAQVSESGIRGRNRGFGRALVQTMDAAWCSGHVGHFGISYAKAVF